MKGDAHEELRSPTDAGCSEVPSTRTLLMELRARTFDVARSLAFFPQRLHRRGVYKSGMVISLLAGAVGTVLISVLESHGEQVRQVAERRALEASNIRRTIDRVRDNDRYCSLILSFSAVAKRSSERSAFVEACTRQLFESYFAIVFAAGRRPTLPPLAGTTIDSLPPTSGRSADSALRNIAAGLLNPDSLLGERLSHPVPWSGQDSTVKKFFWESMLPWFRPDRAYRRARSRALARRLSTFPDSVRRAVQALYSDGYFLPEREAADNYLILRNVIQAGMNAAEQRRANTEAAAHASHAREVQLAGWASMVRRATAWVVLAGIMITLLAGDRAREGADEDREVVRDTAEALRSLD